MRSSVAYGWTQMSLEGRVDRWGEMFKGLILSQAMS